jgi:hypothetical protein
MESSRRRVVAAYSMSAFWAVEARVQPAEAAGKVVTPGGERTSDSGSAVDRTATERANSAFQREGSALSVGSRTADERLCGHQTPFCKADRRRTSSEIINFLGILRLDTGCANRVDRVEFMKSGTCGGERRGSSMATQGVASLLQETLCAQQLLLDL